VTNVWSLAKWAEVEVEEEAEKSLDLIEESTRWPKSSIELVNDCRACDIL